MAARIKLRRDTASNWTSANPVLASGEIGIETDTNKIKIGDGITAWSSLSYFADAASLSSDIVDALNGANSPTGANPFATIADVGGGGDVTKVGVPVNNQVCIWTGDGTVEGDSNLTFDTTTDTLSTVLIAATTVTAALVGNSSTATALQTARNIQGVSFNGTANIDVINGTGFVKATGTTLSYDNSTYLTTAAAASSYQPLDTDLTTIAGLTATTDNFIVSVASAWASRTPAQVNAILPVFTDVLNGIVPLSGGGTTNFLRADGTWAVPSAGANTALSNLASVAINTSLISDADNTDDLGSTSLAWKDVYSYTHKLKGSTSGTITLAATATAGTNTITLPAVTGTVVLREGTETLSGLKTFSGIISTSGGIQTNTSSLSSNLFVFGGNTNGNLGTTAGYIVEGAAGTYARVAMLGNSANVLVADYSGAFFVMGQMGMTEAATGTHPLLAGMILRSPVITGGAGATTNTATLYIEGAPSGITPTGSAYGLWIKAGETSLGGSVRYPTASTSTDITLDNTYYTVKVDASGASRTITLPAASGCTGRVYIIKKTDSSGNTVTIDGNSSETIDGATTKVISTQYAGYAVQSDGTNFIIIGSF